MITLLVVRLGLWLLLHGRSFGEHPTSLVMKIVTVNDKIQRGYTYTLTAPVGRNFDPQFRPELTPKEMLALGVFGGKYMTDCRNEFPASWFTRAQTLAVRFRSSAKLFRRRC